MNIKDALTYARQTLKAAGIENSHFEAKVLLMHMLSCDQTFLITHDNVELSTIQSDTFNAYVARREVGEPVAYITGETGFWDLDLYCNSSTLIPRADTESLVEWAISLPLPKDANVLDLGTGTGAIALAIASSKPEWKVSGVDKIHEAVELATRNAKRNRLDVSFIQSDWFEAIKSQTFDLIVANPPYVENDSPYLERGDLRHEPASALVSNDNGFADLGLIIQKAPAFLSDNGYLLLEHGFAQAKEVSSMLQACQYTDITTRNDLNGLARVTGGQYKNQK